jgi:ABC-2 type transport system ATP-binding protein
MRDMGKKQLMLHLSDELAEIPAELSRYKLDLSDDGRELTYTYDTKGEHTGITDLIQDLRDAGIRFNDLQTSQSSLEEIFVDLVHRDR